MPTDLLCPHMAFDSGFQRILLVLSNEAWGKTFLLKTLKNREPFFVCKIKIYNIRVLKNLYHIVLISFINMVRDFSKF